jgi:RND superfamily putative drug exporter
MLGALAIAPGALLESATFGVIVACVLAVTVGLFAIPASLVLLGRNVDRWQLWSARRENPWVRLSERLSSKPGAAAALAVFPLLLLSTPALALDTGPPNVENLPRTTPRGRATRRSSATAAQAGRRRTRSRSTRADRSQRRRDFAS